LGVVYREKYGWLKPYFFNIFSFATFLEKVAQKSPLYKKAVNSALRSGERQNSPALREGRGQTVAFRFPSLRLNLICLFIMRPYLYNYFKYSWEY